MDEKQTPLNQNQVQEARPTTGIQPNPPSKKQSRFRLLSPSRNFINILLVINFNAVVMPLLLQGLIHIFPTDRNVLLGLLLIPFQAIFFLATCIANLVLIPLYLIKSKPVIGHAILASAALVLSLCLVGFFGYTLTHRTRHPFSDPASDSRYSSAGASSATAYQEVTREKALELMNDCRVSEFIGYNGDITLVDQAGRDGIKRAESYTSGIGAYIGAASYPTVVYTSRTLTPDLLPSARLAREKCASQKELRIYVDNTLEVKASDGTWRTVTAP